ncbi:MAG TPA: hypothetical protein VK458_05580, partial [Myxococcaceae bacterium]|nr:hypothetical protein [Myxococcaceae bacterium]
MRLGIRGEARVAPEVQAGLRFEEGIEQPPRLATRVTARELLQQAAHLAVQGGGGRADARPMRLLPPPGEGEVLAEAQHVPAGKQRVHDERRGLQIGVGGDGDDL